MLLAQPALEGAGKVVARRERGMETFRRLIDSAEIVRAVLQLVTHLVHRQQGTRQGGGMSLAGEQIGKIGEARGLLAIGAVELEDAARDIRRGVSDLHQFMITRQFARQQRICEDLAKLARIAGAFTLKLVEIHLVDGGEAQQELHGQRPLVALDEIEIGRRDGKPLGHRRLGEAERVADAPDLRAGKDLVLRHESNPLHGRAVSQFYKFYFFTDRTCQRQDIITRFQP